MQTFDHVILHMPREGVKEITKFGWRSQGICRVAGYCSTRGGVRLFAKAVAMECAAEADGMRVNTVHPGVIDTPIWTKLSGSGGRNVPIDPNEVAKAGCRSAGLDRLKTSRMACCSSPPKLLIT
jgi:NAD(P)-dependent dehydrogenase (short-subunit alcohol dehydrogenase family)